MANTLPGLDVSHHQEVIDWAAVGAAGMAFCYVKATEGTGFTDPRFTHNRLGAAARGIYSGAYHFFRPKVNIKTQVDRFVAVVGALKPGELPPVLDLEVPEDWAGMSPADCVKLATSWLDAVEQRLGARPLVYTSPAFAKDVMGGSAELAKYALWLAHYAATPKVPQPWKQWTFWQYTETGSVNGIAGKVDLNQFHGTLADLKALLVRGAPALQVRAAKSAGVSPPAAPPRPVARRAAPDRGAVRSGAGARRRAGNSGARKTSGKQARRLTKSVRRKTRQRPARAAKRIAPRRRTKRVAGRGRKKR